MRPTSIRRGIVLWTLLISLGLIAGVLFTMPAAALSGSRPVHPAQMAGTTAITSTVFRDSFDDGTLGAIWTHTGSTWRGESFLSQTSLSGGYLTKALVSNSGISFPNNGITVMAKVRVDSWTDGDGARAGISLSMDAQGNGYNLVFHNDHSTVAFLNDYVTWGPSYTFNWSEGQWYWFKLTMDMGTLRGKVWLDGMPEPASWPYTWVQPLREGYPGLNGGGGGAAGSATASFDSLAITNDLSSTLFADNFDDGALGNAWTNSAGTWTETGIVAQTSATAILSHSNASFPSDQIAVVAKVRVDAWTDGDGARAGVSLSLDTQGNGYNLVFHNDHSTVGFLQDYATWGPSYTFNWSEDQWYWFKLKMEEGILKGKVWLEGTPEPENWPYLWAQSPLNGYPGLNGGGNAHAGGNATVSFDEIRVQVVDPRRGVIGDYWADVVLGKPDFSSLAPNEVTGGRIFNGGGVIVDRASTPNRLYVYDGGNSRVLGFSHLGTCSAGSQAGQACTSNSDCPASTCDIQEGRNPDLVFGQADLNSAGCNRDSNYQNYPQRAPASERTLCSMPESQISPIEGGSFANMAVDGAGNLYVPDFDNHRVLLYQDPFGTDTIADAVWGQNSFSGQECNQGRGVGQPDGSSLCLRSPYNEGFVGGVGVDSQNNLWVTDNQNNRVLRFPYSAATGRPSQTADLVLGQADFSASGHASDMNRMFAPAAVRVDASGKVYVADSLNNRVLVFAPPLSSGMAASQTLGTGLNLPAGLEFDLEGKLWVNDAQNNQLLRFDVSTGLVDRVLFKDVPTYTGQCGGSYDGDGTDFYFPGPQTWMDSFNVCDARGSIGIDADGNVFVAGSTFVQDVWRFPAPFPEPAAGVAHSADEQLLKPYSLGEYNHVSERGLMSPRGVTTWEDQQIIVADAGRILFWNNDSAQVTNGEAADGVIGAPNFNQHLEPHFGPVHVDGNDHLWTLIGNEIRAYALPLTTGATPVLSLTPPLNVAGGGSLTWGDGLNIADLAVSADSAYVWVSDPENSRVFRIRQPLTNPVIDIILGQETSTATQCNQGQAAPAADTLCYPALLSLDLENNLFVSDHSLEVRGNHRLLEYDAALLPANPATAVFALPASRVYGTGGSFSVAGCVDALCGPWEAALDLYRLRMYVGLNGYIGSHFPLVYEDPYSDSSPDEALRDYYSMAYASHVDLYGNLYVADLNRGRVLIYWMTDTLLLTPTPEFVDTSTPEPSETPSPLPTDTNTPTPTVTQTSFYTPTPTRTATLTATPTKTSTVVVTATPTVTATPLPPQERIYLPLVIQNLLSLLH